MNRQFYALRGLAIVIVALNHSIALSVEYARYLGLPSAPEWQNTILILLERLGIFAVPTFLFITGSFFVYAARGSAKIPLKLITGGLKNIVWPYIFWSLLFYLMVYFLRGWRYDLFGYIKNLLVGFPYHFVPLIVFYYLVSPWVFALIRRFGFWLVAAVGIYQLFLTNIVYPGSLGFTFPGWAQVLAPPVLAKTFADWGLFIPLGIFYSLRSTELKPKIERWFALSLVLAVALYLMAALTYLGVIAFHSAPIFASVAFIGAAICLPREKIPFARSLEKIGARAYPIYLSNLIVINLLLAGMGAVFPWAAGQPLLFTPLYFVLALFIPLSIINWIEKSPNLRKARVVFG